MAETAVTSHPYGSARLSAARKTIAQCARSFTGAFTVDELATRVRALDSRAGATATVYRAVAAMQDSGYLEKVGDRGGSALLSRCAHTDHHHHIVCDGCGSTTPTQCPLGPELVNAADRAGFTITRHSVTLYGLCPNCSSKAGL